MNGNISGKVQICGVVSGKASISGTVGGAANGSAGSTSPYSGAYSVTPSADEDIILPTQTKTMSGNLHIGKIP